MFKVIYKDIIIDVIKNPIYCRYFSTTHSKLRTDPTSANCIVSSNGEEVYHLFGTPALPEKYKTVSLVPIDEDEFNYLESLILHGPVVVVDLAEVRKDKVAEMSEESEKTIHKGTNITLSSGETFHFSFSDQDQMQINYLLTSAKTAQMLEDIGLPTNETGNDYPWHADGQDCIFFSREDMLKIGMTMQNFITYHNSYFHALRNYVQSLTSPLVIVDVKYGDKVPKMYWGQVYDFMA